MLALFLDTAKQLDPLIIASHLVFIPGLSFLVSPLVGNILHKLSANVALIIGLLLAALGTFLITNTDETTSYLNTIWHLAIFGVSVAINSRPLHQAGMAGAINTVIRQIGGAMGPAIAGSVFARALASGAPLPKVFPFGTLHDHTVAGPGGGVVHSGRAGGPEELTYPEQVPPQTNFYLERLISDGFRGFSTAEVGLWGTSREPPGVAGCIIKTCAFQLLSPRGGRALTARASL